MKPYSYWVQKYNNAASVRSAGWTYNYVKRFKYDEFKEADFPFSKRSTSSGIGGKWWHNPLSIHTREEEEFSMTDMLTSAIRFDDKTFDTILNYPAPDEIDVEDLRLEELRGMLLVRIYELCDLNLTEHQKMLLKLRLDGLTYLAIAEKLGCNYTAVAHGLEGIRKSAYENVQGGVYRKLKKITDEDSKCKDILREIKQRQRMVYAS